MKELTFEEKVKSMSAGEIIMAMVKGLENPKVVIDMGTFGDISNGICFGCAATNTICEISGKVFEDDSICTAHTRASFLDVDFYFLTKFENCIDCLRGGDIATYNDLTLRIGIAKIKPFNKLPYLDDNYTEKDLGAYRILAEMQENL